MFAQCHLCISKKFLLSQQEVWTQNCDLTNVWSEIIDNIDVVDLTQNHEFVIMYN